MSFYDTLREKTNRGWNTWNTASVLSHVYLPYGFAINLSFREPSEADVIREPLVGRFGEREEHIIPGPRSWDGTYTCLTIEYARCSFRAESSSKDGEQYILLTPLTQGFRPPVIWVEACLLWGRDGMIGKQEGRLFGQFGETRISIFCDGKIANDPYGRTHAPCFSFPLDRPVAVSTVTCTAEEARRIIDEGRQRTEAAARSFGAMAEVYTAMKCCLAWDTIYEPEHDRICSPVSRIWNLGWGGYVLFDWDTYFASQMASIDREELAWLNCYAITHEVTEEGFIPNFGAAEDMKSRDRSQPPVGAAALLRIFRRYPRAQAVKELYPVLFRWNRWFGEHRTTPEGYLAWGSDPFSPRSGRYWEEHDVGNTAGAALESGLDNSPMYDGIGYDPETHLSLLADVGLMGLYIRDCTALMDLCVIAGHPEDRAELEARRDRTEEALETLWSEERGIYENRDLMTGLLSERHSPTNFYALFSGRVTAERKERILREHLLNEGEFGGEWVLPSIARSDPAFPDQNYWRGRIWAPMNYLVYEALLTAGLNEEAGWLAEKSERLLLREWRMHGHVHENYSAFDGMGCGVPNSDKFYHWGGLLGYIALLEHERKD